MNYGFVKVCAASPEIRVADCGYNVQSIFALVKKAEEKGVKLAVFPELCITGYTCGDLFLQNVLIDGAEKALAELCELTGETDMIIAVGAPVKKGQKLYNCAVLLYRGNILAVVPKSNIPNYGEFYELRHFSPAEDGVSFVELNGEDVPFGTKIIVRDRNMKNFALAAEICEDLWTVNPPSNLHALAGATVIANLSASNETVGKEEYRKTLVSGQSAKLFCAYIYADAGFGESTQDLVFAGDDMICENGRVLARSKLFGDNNIAVTEIDVDRLAFDRQKTNTFEPTSADDYYIVEIEFDLAETELTRVVEKMPFVPQNPAEREKYSEKILQIQAYGLAKRLKHTGAQSAVLGLSGGLDSTLSLLVTARAFDLLGMERKAITAVTMPCFGTTSRTYNNAVNMARQMGAELLEVNIKSAVLQHFADIGHAEDVFDVTYENSQARERTQVLMDIANKKGGLVIGTGDMSELALGWATYNGDHMSMYGTNCGVPKTLIRYLVEYEASKTADAKLRGTLEDILDTPVSPELLPPKDGKIAQKTEQFVGPYLLHDFFLYYMMRFGFAPDKIFRLACYSFAGEFEREEILKWLKVFYRRFFTQQFKRSCLPDGPKVGSVALSPRGDLRMPSDACGELWLKQIEQIV